MRIAHLGLGAFHRAHQAWYTQRANELAAERWSITAFTGRNPAAAELLEAQGCRYTLLTRGPTSDSATEITSIRSAHDGADVAARTSALSDPETAVVTLTVTEAGYLPGATPPARLADGLRARMTAGAGPIAIVSCDNLPNNGQVAKLAVLAVAEAALAEWIAANVSFVSSMVDRITPATTDDDRRIARELVGWNDRVPVVTEAFSEWVLHGHFPAGRPAWDSVGAEFVENLEPYESRKLWLLNAGHSLLAYRGLELGFETVFDAFNDPRLRAEVEQLWTEAREVLTLPADSLDTWLAALRDRFSNPRIQHRLAQIAMGGEQKIPARIGAVARARQAAGLPTGVAGAETIAAWERYRARGGPQ